MPNTFAMVKLPTHRKHDDDVWFSLHNNGKVEADLKSLESLMNDNILDLRCWNESSRGGRAV